MSDPSISFCLQCAREFHPRSPDVLVCPQCGGPPEADASQPADPSKIRLNSYSSGTLLEPSEAQTQKEAEEYDEWQPGEELLGTYTVVGLLGAGGMGKVFCVHHNSWNLDLAVKSPRKAFFKSEEQKEAFKTEAETWVNLGLHPHIVSCYYVRSIDNIPRVFAELVEGGSLEEWIRQGRITKVDHALDIAIQFAWGLGYAHEQGLVHRDVKPANVLVTRDGTVKVTDFGLAKGGIGMTPAYVSPEQAEAQLKDVELTPQSDMWSWGLSVLEMFAGQPFWVRANKPDYTWGQVAAQALEHYLTGGLEDAAIPQMPRGLAQLLRECFQKNPADRPASLDVVAERLVNIYAAEIHHPYPRQKSKAAELRADSLNNKALSLLDLGQSSASIQNWVKALEADPIHPEATYNHALYLWRKGEINDLEVVRRLEKVMGSDQDKRPAAYLLGLVHMERGDLPEALKTLQGLETLPEVQDLKTSIEHLQPGIELIMKMEGHHRSVQCVAFSPDGKHILSASGDRTLRLWQVETGACLRTFSGHQLPVNCAVFSPDGQRILSGSEGINHEDTLRLWDAGTGNCLRILKGHEETVYSIAFSSDGRYALSGSADNTVRLWDVETGNCLRKFEDNEGEVLFVAFNSKGRYAIAGANGSTARIWDLNTGECIDVLILQDGVTSFSYIPEKNWLLTGAEDSSLILWNAESGDQIRAFESEEGEIISALAFSPDGHFILSGSKNPGILRWWHTNSRKCMRTFSEHEEDVNSIAFSPDGRYAATGSGSGFEKDNAVRIWDLSKIDLYQAPFHPSLPASGSKTLSDEKIFLQHINQARDAFILGNYPHALQELRQARSIRGYERHESALEVQELLYSKCEKTRLHAGWLEHTFYGHQDDVKSIAFSHDGRYALSGSLDKTVRLWDIPSRDLRYVFQGHKREVTAVSFTPDGRYALSGGKDKTLRLWDLNSGDCLSIINLDDTTESFAISPDGQYIFCNQYQKGQIIDIKRGLVRRSLEHGSYIVTVAYSPDGSLVLTGGQDKTMKLWAMDTGEYIRSFTGHTETVQTVAFSPDGHYALSGSWDNTIRYWDIHQGNCLKILNAPFFVDSVTFSPDGRYALSASGQVHLWDLGTGECLQRFTEHDNRVESVAFSPNGRYAISGSRDCTLKLWFLDWELNAHDPADWDEGARPYLEIFLTLHTLYGPDGLNRQGKPGWIEEDFQNLLIELGARGYGWLRPAGVRRKLEEMAAERG